MQNLRTKIAGLGFYVPENVVTNFDLMKVMSTTDEWIQERTGIVERRYATRYKECTSTMGAAAAKTAIERAGITPQDVDFIIFGTLSPDYYFPGGGVLVQRILGIPEGVPALDIRNQCSGFIYGLSIADKFIRTGTYKNVLVVGAEMHSAGIDFSTRGRNVTVIFGDGGGAALLQPTTKENQGILASNIHADGTFAEKLAYPNPGSHGGIFTGDSHVFDKENPFSSMMYTQKMIDEGAHYPVMDGPFVFKNAVRRFPETIDESLAQAGLERKDVDMFVLHQANLRISQFVQGMMDIPDEKIYNNIQKYGNTTAASIPIALTEVWEQGRIKEGDLVCLAAFGSGFTWGSVLLRW